MSDTASQHSRHSNEQSSRTNGAQPGQRVVPARRQGIFWLLTVPVTNTAFASMCSTGTLGSGIVWLRGQEEEGGTTGYRHYQAVAAFNKKVSLASITRLFGTGLHAELSTSPAANDYVWKEDTRVGTPFEYGKKPIQRNNPKDWDSIWESAVKGDLMAIPSSIRVSSYFALRAIRADSAECPALERTIYVFWGRTGTGKSHRAWDEAGIDAFPKDPRSKFWCGYRGQENVVIDEFRGVVDIATLLRWCDRYPLHVETKGSSQPFLAQRIWITSNLSPEAWYPELDSETLSALLRRLTITHFN
nr:MAG: replication associated protein [Cressdnaviricota sp.]